MTYDVYSAFGNRVRTKLIRCLSGRAMNVSQLIGNCGLAQSAVSQHLAKLKRSGLVAAEKQGKEVYYSLRYARAAEIAKLLIQLEARVA